MGIVLVVTLWKLPMLIKILQINGHMEKSEAFKQSLSELDKLKLRRAGNRILMSIHGCIAYTFFSLLYDIPTAPIALIVCIAFPWRVYAVYDLVIKPGDRLPLKFSIKAFFQFRRIIPLLAITLMLLADALLVILSTIILCTLWRAKDLFIVFQEHHNRWILIRNKAIPNVDDNLFSLNVRVYLEFCYLCLDIGQIVQLAMIICLLLRIWPLICRIMNILKIRKKEGRILARQEKIRVDSSQEKNLMSLSHNVLAIVLTYCNVPEIMKFEMTCRKGYEVGLVPRVYRTLYEKLYRSIVQIPPAAGEPDYKHYCIDGYKIAQDQARREGKEIVSEEIRDNFLGIRFVICEESIYSVINSPHLLICPIKALAYVIYHGRKCTTFLSNFVAARQDFHQYSISDIYHTGPHSDITHLTQRDSMEINNFWRVQDSLLATILIIYADISKLISYFLCKISYQIMKITSGNIIQPFQIQEYRNYLIPNMQVPPPQNINFYYGLQMLTYPLFLFINILPFAILPWIWYYIYDDSFFHSLLGPYGVNIFTYGIGLSTLTTVIDLTQYFVYYHPVKGTLYKDYSLAFFLLIVYIAVSIHTGLSYCADKAYYAELFVYNKIICKFLCYVVIIRSCIMRNWKCNNGYLQWRRKNMQYNKQQTL